MQRLTISLDDDLAARFDLIVSERRYASRSEAVRDLVRELVDKERLAAERTGTCVASLSYVYDHRIRSLAQRLLDMQHDHHTLVVATTHVILDHQSSLETVILRGSTADVDALADQIIAERGVRFGAVNVISVEGNDDHDDPAPHQHNGHAPCVPIPGLSSCAADHDALSPAAEVAGEERAHRQHRHLHRQITQRAQTLSALGG